MPSVRRVVMQFVFLFLFLSFPLIIINILPNIPRVVKVAAFKALKFLIGLVQFVLDESAAMWAEVTGVALKKLEKLQEESQTW